jgi:hypothetical protein
VIDRFRTVAGPLAALAAADLPPDTPIGLPRR